MIKILSAGVGKILNYSKLATIVGISTIILKKYLWYSEKTFVIQTLAPFFKNSVKELTKSRTVYFYDCGLRNFANNTFNLIENDNELGFLFQNLVKNLIREKINWTSWSIKYWRTTDKAEVDFIITNGTEIIPIEVKYSSIKSTSIKRSLRSFIERYSPRNAYVINLSFNGEIKINNTIVKIIPFYKLITLSIFHQKYG